MPDAHSPVAPAWPNASIDFNAVHEAAMKGQIEKALTPEALLIAEHPDTAIAEAAATAAAAKAEAAAKPAAKPAA